MAGGELAHREVVEDEQVGFDVGGEAFVKGTVGVAAGEVGQQAAGLVEADLGAGADGQVPTFGWRTAPCARPRRRGR